METAEKSTKRQTLVSKILAGLYYFVMGTWPFWILLYFNIDYQMHNAKNSPYKTVGTVYEVGYKRISYMDLTFYVNNKKYMASTSNVCSFGDVKIGNDTITDCVGLKFMVSYLPENPSKYYYVHTDSVIVDAVK